MLHLFKIISQRIKKWYYYQELKEISSLTIIMAIIYLIYNHGINILKLIFTETGLLISAFVLVSAIIGIAIKIYFRIIIIKYHEKSTNIELFKNLKERI